MSEILNILMIFGGVCLALSFLLMILGFDYEFELGSDNVFSINVILLAMTFFFFGSALGITFLNSEFLGFIIGFISFFIGFKIGKFLISLIIKSENTDIINTESFIGKEGVVTIISDNSLVKVSVQGKEFIGTSIDDLKENDIIIVESINGIQLILRKKGES